MQLIILCNLHERLLQPDAIASFAAPSTRACKRLRESKPSGSCKVSLKLKLSIYLHASIRNRLPKREVKLSLYALAPHWCCHATGHQTLHLLVGFICVFGGQLKAVENSFRFDRVPMTLCNCEVRSFFL